MFFINWIAAVNCSFVVAGVAVGGVAHQGGSDLRRGRSTTIMKTHQHQNLRTMPPGLTSSIE